MALQWSSALSIGVPNLDAQHRELFDRLDKLLDSMLHHDQGEASSLADFMRHHVVLHFAAEEQLMRDLDFPNAERHIEEHRAFAASMLELDEAFRANGTSHELVLRLERALVAWVRDHIYVADVALGHFVTATLGAEVSWA